MWKEEEAARRCNAGSQHVREWFMCTSPILWQGLPVTHAVGLGKVPGVATMRHTDQRRPCTLPLSDPLCPCCLCRTLQQQPRGSPPPLHTETPVCIPGALGDID